MSTESLSALIKEPRLDLYRAERERRSMEDAVARMRSDIHLNLLTAEPDLVRGFDLSFDYREPRKAQRTLRALIDRIRDETSTRETIPHLQTRLASLEQRLRPAPVAAQGAAQSRWEDAVYLEPLDVPSLPEKSDYPNRALFAAIGFGAGLVSALLLWLIRQYARPVAQTA